MNNSSLARAKMEGVYCKSAALLDEAKNELSSGVATGLHQEFLSLKFTASVIHNDVCREFHNLAANSTIGTSKLLALGPIILKLFEANLWYSKFGNKKLCELAGSRGMRPMVEAKLKKMKLLGPSRICKYKKYKNIRDKLVAHYDQISDDQILNVIQELESVQSDKFFEDVEMMLRYGQEWLQVLSSIGKLTPIVS